VLALPLRWLLAVEVTRLCRPLCSLCAATAFRSPSKHATPHLARSNASPCNRSGPPSALLRKTTGLQDHRTTDLLRLPGAMRPSRECSPLRCNARGSLGRPARKEGSRNLLRSDPSRRGAPGRGARSVRESLGVPPLERSVFLVRAVIDRRARFGRRARESKNPESPV